MNISDDTPNQKSLQQQPRPTHEYVGAGVPDRWCCDKEFYTYAVKTNLKLLKCWVDWAIQENLKFLPMTISTNVPFQFSEPWGNGILTVSVGGTHPEYDPNSGKFWAVEECATENWGYCGGGWDEALKNKKEI